MENEILWGNMGHDNQDDIITPIRACTVGSNILQFEHLIDEMELTFGDAWGDLQVAEIVQFLTQEDAKTLELLVFALSNADANDHEAICQVVQSAATANIPSIVVAADISPAALHKIMRAGAQEFLPYPLPEGEMQACIQRINAPAPSAPEVSPMTDMVEPLPSTVKAGPGTKNGDVIVCHGLAGGVGTTTLAVNLAWELAAQGTSSVCLIDLDLQFGSVATYLDLDRKSAILQLLTDIDAIDDHSFRQALQVSGDKLSVFTSPKELVPLDILTNDDVKKLIAIAKSHFDIVVIDAPTTIVSWSQVLLEEATTYLGMMDIDMRSAQNIMRYVSLLEAEKIGYNNLRYVVNRAPKFTDLNGKTRMKRLSESLGIEIDFTLPDGSKHVAHACDHGEPLAIQAPKNPLRKEIEKMAKALMDEMTNLQNVA